MKDFLGREVKVGDTVAFAQTGYRDLLTGNVTKLSPKTALINVTGRKDWAGRPGQTRRESSHMVLIESKA
ncbi:MULTISPECIES: hypothetical protein [Burkholderia]|uniref:hypothetical protein n=1 Tax=Burkholderia TaxID=32008 RepID=UPI000756D200|nr:MULTISPECIES: hypothetical protein [Burkholderia]AOJ69194.1 hypothetical protein WS78_10825 [Burkholderia savannae]KVG39833.1 hypothetical protein WS77_19375 [Burkholderia sp. MSMB0265]KVG85755.1 hypothetical protein WS81_31300 [Burkholderia sp. MSMB2040]KVG92229.1 hypothetical protein WS82_12350 [Burkholderia sp. MSMB2041]KVG95692.1 hypothetical protein WS83_03885 [Burkholderia sp. MSMB2042]